MKFNTLAFAAVLLGGCGIPDDTLLTEIDSDLWAKVCAKVAEDQPAESYTCGEVTIEVPAQTQAEHEAACNEAWGDTSTWTGCTATFGDWIEFNEWEPADPCDPGTPPAAWTTVYDCIVDSMAM
ncbi:MAG: hypothetical protein KC656_05780 [Myxococcales bacterium]|nr:hypothetical protein [Myxococcales bacterium]MCA9567329.1 hypothetical protein [Myxococcales bacterium]MCB9670704.1 hypothetical protein [Alphaproteobacteria bacterium]MCB9694754.1 hypothetical protein [Alphaproteobacteria bacterium]